MLKVLVVDDDLVTLEVTRAILESLGHTVVTRDRPVGTTSTIIAERPDVVVVDVEMPALSGDELIRMISEADLAGEAVPRFILHSGARANDLDRLVAETGAIGSIEKTGSPARFAAAFEAIVRGS